MTCIIKSLNNLSNKNIHLVVRKEEGRIIRHVTHYTRSNLDFKQIAGGGVMKKYEIKLLHNRPWLS